MHPGPGAVAPTAAQAGRALLTRVLVPTAVLWVVVVGAGFALAALDVSERDISQWFVDARTPTLDSVTAVVSGLADTQVMIATCLVVAGLVWWRTARWWFAVVPPLALSLEAAVFLTSSIVVGRDRPDVDQLDHAPPTSSFPSGHTGASTAVYLAFALMATRIRHAGLRVTVIVVCALVPVGVALARVYRGMHHPTDVVAGLAVGATCALIAWCWLPARDRSSEIQSSGTQRASAAEKRSSN